jgi:hypothetical protein
VRDIHNQCAQIAQKEANEMNECPMCGKEAKRLVGRWYQYDNGEQFIAWVCTACADLHANLVSK